MSKCETTSCPTECDETPKCPTQSGGDCCPVEASVAMWKAAFPQAMRQVQVQILAEKIRGEWGPILEQEADATLTAMGACWQSMLAKGKAEADLRDSFRSILEAAAKA